MWAEMLQISNIDDSGGTAPYGKIPKATSSNTNINSSGASGNNQPYKAFDEDDSTFYESAGYGPQWLEYIFETPLSIKNVYLKSTTATIACAYAIEIGTSSGTQAFTTPSVSANDIKNGYTFDDNGSMDIKNATYIKISNILNVGSQYGSFARMNIIQINV